MAGTAKVESLERWVLVREIGELTEPEREHAERLSHIVGSAIDGQDPGKQEVAATALYDMVDMVTWLEAEEVKNLDAGDVYAILKASTENMDGMAEEVLDG